MKTPVLRIAFLLLPCSLSAFYSLTSALAKQENRSDIAKIFLRVGRGQLDNFGRELVKLKVLYSPIRHFRWNCLSKRELSTESPVFRADSEPLVLVIPCSGIQLYLPTLRICLRDQTCFRLFVLRCVSELNG